MILAHARAALVEALAALLVADLEREDREVLERPPNLEVSRSLVREAREALRA